MKKVALTIATAITLAACTVQPKPTTTSTVDSESSKTAEQLIADQLLIDAETPEPVIRPVYQATETRKNDLVHTKLEVEFLWATKQLKGKAEITLKAHFYDAKTVKLDAKALDIKSVSVGKSKKPLQFKHDGHVLEVELDRSYKKTEKYTLNIDYIANPEKVTQEGSAAISSAKGLYFINPDSTEVNKPTQIWTQGETEASSCWFPTIDSPNQKSSQEIYITVDSKYKTLSNGLLVYSTPNKNGTRTDYWKQEKKHAPYLFMMAVGDFAVVKDEWVRKDGSKMAVHYYVEKDYEKHAKAIFGKTPKMLTYFSDLLGVEYPWDKYHQVVVRDYVSGAMENTSAVIHGDFLHQTEREIIDGGNESIIAHELFHHWFGDLVTSESWSNLPLNESFANYSQFLWDEFEHGQMEADMNAFSEGEGYLISSEQQGFVDMVRYDYGSKEEMFDANSYNKGGRILNMLRNYVGDEAFFASLKKYLTDNAYGSTEIDNLRLAFEDVTGEDLHWFFNQWFLDKGHPILDFEQSYSVTDKKQMVIIEQTQDFEQVPLYKLPIQIDIYTNGKASREMVWADDVIDTFYFDVATQPDLVNIDAQKMLLCRKKDNKSTEQWIYQLNNAPLWLDKKEAFDKLGKSSNDEAKKAIANALDHPFWHVKVMALNKAKKAIRDDKEGMKAKIKALTNHEHPKVRLTAIKTLQKHYSTDESLQSVYEAATKDKSYAVMARGIEAIAEANPSKAMQLAKKYEAEEGGAVKNAVASIYAKYGGKEQHQYFLDGLEKASGFSKYGFLQTYNKYLKRQDEKEMAKGLAIFEDVARNGSPWFLKLSGYQLLDDAVKTYTNIASEHALKAETLTKEGSTMDAAQEDQARVKAENKAKEIKALLKTMKSEETDANVLQYINY